MKLYIKNMVCDRCRLAVKQQLEQNNFKYHTLELGEVGLIQAPSKNQLEKFRKNISQLGFELIEDKRAREISRIKKTVIELVHYSGTKRKNLSDYLQEALHKDFGLLSSLFSAVEGITLEKYFIQQKIERVKELLVYNELTLSQIASDLGYSSVNHLSTQFKKITGLTPTHFKKIGAQKRKSLDKV